MGSEGGRADEAPSHEVELSPFSLGRIPVTRAEYEPFLAATETSPPPWWFDSDFGNPDQPVVGVTWFEAVAFTEWLSRQCGGRWRLPTEAEWERAARGGLAAAATAWGASVPDGEVPTGRLDAPWPVGRGFANPYGLYDISTIVHEWCLDWYGADYYREAPRVDPRDDVDDRACDRRAARGVDDERLPARLVRAIHHAARLPGLPAARRGIRTSSRGVGSWLPRGSRARDGAHDSSGSPAARRCANIAHSEAHARCAAPTAGC